MIHLSSLQLNLFTALDLYTTFIPHRVLKTRQIFPITSYLKIHERCLPHTRIESMIKLLSICQMHSYCSYLFPKYNMVPLYLWFGKSKIKLLFCL